MADITTLRDLITWAHEHICEVADALGVPMTGRNPTERVCPVHGSDGGGALKLHPLGSSTTYDGAWYCHACTWTHDGNDRVYSDSGMHRSSIGGSSLDFVMWIQHGRITNDSSTEIYKSAVETLAKIARDHGLTVELQRSSKPSRQAKSRKAEKRNRAEPALDVAAIADICRCIIEDVRDSELRLTRPHVDYLAAKWGVTDQAVLDRYLVHSVIMHNNIYTRLHEVEHNTTGDNQSMWTGRIVWPAYYDGHWSLVARTTYEGDRAPKYIKVRGVPCGVVGGHLLEHLPADVDHIWLVEGPGDAMALAQAGEVAVALCGVNADDDVLRWLCRVVDGRQIRVLLDNDEPGRAAAPMLALRVTGTVYQLPDGQHKDVAEYLQSGGSLDDITPGPDPLDTYIHEAADRAIAQRLDVAQAIIDAVRRLDILATDSLHSVADRVRQICKGIAGLTPLAIERIASAVVIPYLMSRARDNDRLNDAERAFAVAFYEAIASAKAANERGGIDYGQAAVIAWSAVQGRNDTALFLSLEDEIARLILGESGTDLYDQKQYMAYISHLLQISTPATAHKIAIALRGAVYTTSRVSVVDCWGARYRDDIIIGRDDKSCIIINKDGVRQCSMYDSALHVMPLPPTNYLGSWGNIKLPESPEALRRYLEFLASASVFGGDAELQRVAGIHIMMWPFAAIRGLHRPIMRIVAPTQAGKSRTLNIILDLVQGDAAHMLGYKTTPVARRNAATGSPILPIDNLNMLSEGDDLVDYIFAIYNADVISTGSTSQKGRNCVYQMCTLAFITSTTEIIDHEEVANRIWVIESDIDNINKLKVEWMKSGRPEFAMFWEQHLVRPYRADFLNWCVYIAHTVLKLYPALQQADGTDYIAAAIQEHNILPLDSPVLRPITWVSYMCLTSAIVDYVLDKGYLPSQWDKTLTNYLADTLKTLLPKMHEMAMTSTQAQADNSPLLGAISRAINNLIRDADRYTSMSCPYSVRHLPDVNAKVYYITWDDVKDHIPRDLHNKQEVKMFMSATRPTKHALVRETLDRLQAEHPEWELRMDDTKYIHPNGKTKRAWALVVYRDKTGVDYTQPSSDTDGIAF